MNKFLLASFALFGLILIEAAAAAAAANIDVGSRKAVDNVLAKLALYEQGFDVSELTMEELEAAHNEYNSWSQKAKDKIQSREPLVQLLHDFLMVPMNAFHQQVGHRDQDPEIRRSFVERLQLNYKRFKPLYFGQRNSAYYMRSPKTDALILSIFGLKDAPALNAKMILAAQNEYLAMKAKAEEIVNYEDVYASLKELERIKNYLNRNQVKMLVEDIFPLVPDVKSFNDQIADKIKKIGVSSLKKNNLVIDNGEIKQVIYVDQNGKPIQRG